MKFTVAVLPARDQDGEKPEAKLTAAVDEAVPPFHA